MRFPKQKGKGEDQSTMEVNQSAKVRPKSKGENSVEKLFPIGKEVGQSTKEVPVSKGKDQATNRISKDKAEGKNVKLASKCQGDYVTVEAVNAAKTRKVMRGKKESQLKSDEETDARQAVYPVPPDNEMRQAMQGTSLDSRGRSRSRRNRDMPRKEEPPPISSSSTSSPSPSPRSHSKR